MLTIDRLREAFDLLGSDLVARDLFIEIAVYGGSAIMLQFEWRRATEDVDAVVRGGFDERDLAPSVRVVAERLGLSHDWLNNAVGMFTPLDEPDILFELAGTYPAGAVGGLRVFVANPRYLLAMKLRALSATDRGGRDLSDARALAADLRLTRPDDLRDLYVAIHDEEPSWEVSRQFADVVRSP